MPSTLCDEGLTEMIFFRTFLMKKGICEVWLRGAALALFVQLFGRPPLFLQFLQIGAGCRIRPLTLYLHLRSLGDRCSCLDCVDFDERLATLGLSMEVWAPAL